jgi:hypothetical protein
MDKEGHNPWIKRDKTHGKRGTRPMDKEGHNPWKIEGHKPWIKRGMAHG